MSTLNLTICLQIYTLHIFILLITFISTWRTPFITPCMTVLVWWSSIALACKSIFLHLGMIVLLVIVFLLAVFSFSTMNVVSNLLLTWKIFTEKSTDNEVDFPWNKFYGNSLIWNRFLFSCYFQNSSVILDWKMDQSFFWCRSLCI